MACLLKVIACEIAVREFYHVAARSPNLIDFEFLNQGYHDLPSKGREELQRRIDAVPAGKYDAIIIGYGLCSNLLAGIRSQNTKLVIPRAHDCITLFLGSSKRYSEVFSERPGTYYYTSGWIECGKRRGLEPDALLNANIPAGPGGGYDEWVRKYGEDQAKYLVEEMSRWLQAYTHGTLIDFDFTQVLKLEEQVRVICEKRGWQFSKMSGSLRLFEALLNRNGNWPAEDFLVLEPGEVLAPSFKESIIKGEKLPRKPTSP